MTRHTILVASLSLSLWCLTTARSAERLVSATEMGEPLAGTAKLSWQGDIASRMVDGIDRFLSRQTKASPDRRAAHWHRDAASAEKYAASVEPNRRRLAKIIGAVDPRLPFEAPEIVSTVKRSGVVGRGKNYEILAVRWPAIGVIHGEGLLLRPSDGQPIADVVVIPDADQTPEQITGLSPGVEPESQMARRLAESGCRVIVPALIDRTLVRRRGATLTNREFLYRPAYELGRHLIGYEVQKVLAAVDWFTHESAERPQGVFGWGEGGLLALYAGALDERIDAVGVSGYFDARENLWQEPVDRNVFGLLDEFGDAELASMIAPRALVVEAARGPEVVLPPGKGGAPGRLSTPRLEDVRRTFQRAITLVGSDDLTSRFRLTISGSDGRSAFATDETLAAFLVSLHPAATLAPEGERPQPAAAAADPRRRLARPIDEIDRYTQRLLVESPYTRRKFFERLDTSSAQRFRETIEPYRRYFAEEVIGQFSQPRLPPHARSRKVFDEPAYEGFQVVLDVLPDVLAYGLLLVPKGMVAGEQRPVVVCQHGLEGRPRDVADPSVKNPAYEQFACRLAQQGFITFAPQNPYLFGDRFRTLQRKANPLKKTLFSIIVPQHLQITDWLAGLPMVDQKRIAFYGLSYGGKTAMRVPALVKRYCLSICSGDFNDWVWKNASTRSPYSYVWTGEYEIFEFNLGGTFNYAEMAALIAPRPFMVERGHFDGVAPDERVAYEFAKVRHLYAAQLGLADQTEIEWFVGPHKINGKRTFAFLHHHLHWP